MELLSPAGDFESLKTAIRCGADAIYVGGPSFSARKNAKNFTEEELLEAVDFCHLRCVKLYVAVNILIKETELIAVTDYIKKLIEIGTDGIIVQDLGLFCKIREMSDEIRLNASTQMTVCSADGVNLLEDLGANRVVLARELSEKETEAIRSKTQIELEKFVHGALCICWSGQCQMSSVIGGRSGNRGACAQPCRLPYTLMKNGKQISQTAPLLSTKDLCLVREMDKVCAISDSAKIEGRMKSAEYTGVVTKVYKKALLKKAEDTEIQEMLSFFSRGGSCTGYFKGRSFRDMMEQGASGKISATKSQEAEIRQTDFEKKRTIAFSLTAKVGETISLLGVCEGFSAKATGDALEEAKNGVPDKERIKMQLSRLGDTPFVCEDIEIASEGKPFVAVSVLNGLRREVCEKLTKQICDSYRRKAKEATFSFAKNTRKPKKPKLCVQVTTREQYEVAKRLMADEIYAPFALKKEDTTTVLPSVTKEGEPILFGEAASVLIQNLGQIKEAKGKILYGGERLNVTNSETVRRLFALGFLRVTLSWELNRQEMQKVAEHTDLPLEIICYGRLPLMLIENCIIKSTYHCVKGESGFSLCDRKGEQFPILCEGCRNVVLNSVPLYMADKLEDVLSLKPDAIRLMFTVENGGQCEAVIRAYQNAMEGKPSQNPFEKITRGHFYRGVE